MSNHYSEWDKIKEENPNLKEDMEIIEKLFSSIKDGDTEHLPLMKAIDWDKIEVNAGTAQRSFYQDPGSEPAPAEMVSHPAHYGGEDNPYEAIKVIEAWECNYNIGTVLRYLCRCGKKTIGGTAEQMRLEDLKKARWYLDREIHNIELGK